MILFTILSVFWLFPQPAQFPWHNIGVDAPLKCRMYTVQFTVYTVQFKLYAVQFTLYTVQFTLYTVQFTLYTVQFTLYTVQFTLYIVQFTLYTVCCQHVRINSSAWTVCRELWTLNSGCTIIKRKFLILLHCHLEFIVVNPKWVCSETRAKVKYNLWSEMWKMCKRWFIYMWRLEKKNC